MNKPVPLPMLLAVLSLMLTVAAGGSDGAGDPMLQTAGGAQKLLFSTDGAAQ